MRYTEVISGEETDHSNDHQDDLDYQSKHIL